MPFVYFNRLLATVASSQYGFTCCCCFEKIAVLKTRINALTLAVSGLVYVLSSAIAFSFRCSNELNMSCALIGRSKKLKAIQKIPVFDGRYICLRYFSG